MRNQAIAIMGPTASGKTALGIELAKCCNGEVISVDSALVYRTMDIGTAKPTDEERDGIVHHLIDILDPSQSYSVTQFCQDATALIGDIQSRNKRPILVGGTMMYFNALINGISAMPKSDQTIRQQLVQEAETSGWQALHEQLSAIDPVSASRIHPNDPQRLTRALEVYRISGKTLTYWQQQSKAACPYPIVQFAIAPSERAALHSRIAQRFDLMLENDFIEEVRALHARDDLHIDLPSIRSVGYRQVWEYLDGNVSYDEMRERGIIATRQLAKRQLTWLRGWQNVTWLDTFKKDNLTKIAAKVTLD